MNVGLLGCFYVAGDTWSNHDSCGGGQNNDGDSDDDGGGVANNNNNNILYSASTIIGALSAVQINNCNRTHINMLLQLA